MAGTARSAGFRENERSMNAGPPARPVTRAGAHRPEGHTAAAKPSPAAPSPAKPAAGRARALAPLPHPAAHRQGDRNHRMGKDVNEGRSQAWADRGRRSPRPAMARLAVPLAEPSTEPSARSH